MMSLKWQLIRTQIQAALEEQEEKQDQEHSWVPALKTSVGLFEPVPARHKRREGLKTGKQLDFQLTEQHYTTNFPCYFLLMPYKLILIKKFTFSQILIPNTQHFTPSLKS